MMPRVEYRLSMSGIGVRKILLLFILNELQWRHCSALVGWSQRPASWERRQRWTLFHDILTGADSTA